MKTLLVLPLIIGFVATKQLPPIQLQERKNKAILVKPKIRHEIAPKKQEDYAWRSMVEAVKDFEGFRNRPYVCSGGRLTIGYGHTLTAKKYKQISKTEAEKLLEMDLKRAKKKVMAHVAVPLTDAQLACLTSFTFNCGEGSLKRLVGGNMRLNSGNYESVEKILPQYRKAGGKVLRGLEKRRQWEMTLWNQENGFLAQKD